MRWLKNLFRKKQYWDKSTMWNFLSYYADCESELTSMKRYISEGAKFESGSCSDYRIMPSKRIRIRYGINELSPGLAWYLLEQYFKGNITIKEDVQPKS